MSEKTDTSRILKRLKLQASVGKSAHAKRLLRGTGVVRRTKKVERAAEHVQKPAGK